ncbi:MAG: hypothetical protein WAV68_02520 [Candidatus Nanogingivalis sp.]
MGHSTFQEIFARISLCEPFERDIHDWKYLFKNLKLEMDTSKKEGFEIDFFSVDGYEFLEDFFYGNSNNQSISPVFTKILIDIFGEEYVWGEGGFCCWRNKEILASFISRSAVDDEEIETFESDREFVMDSWWNFVKSNVPKIP